jgi:hypothetical protein
MIDRNVTLIVKLHQPTTLQLKLSIDERPVMHAMVSKVFRIYSHPRVRFLIVRSLLDIYGHIMRSTMSIVLF